MKHMLTMAFVAALCAPCALAQNITVVMKDGTSHKFNADYVSEITFKEVAPESPAVQFTSLSLTPYSNGNFAVAFREPDKGIELTIDATSESSATWLFPGNYSSENQSEYYISLNYSNLKIDNESVEMGLTTMQVTLEDDVYTFDVSVELKDGTTFKGTYSGELSTYTKHLEKVISSASYNENEREHGNFYVKMDASDYTIEMALDIFADPTATQLPAGEYVYATDCSVGSIGQNSYVDLYYPYSGNKLAEGSKMTVTEENGVYNFDMNFIFENGRTAHITYNGEISGTPTFKEDVEPTIPTDVEFTSYSTIDYGNGNIGCKFETEDVTCFLDVYGPSDMTDVLPGTYTIVEEANAGNVCIRYSKLTCGEAEYKFASGTFTVTEVTGESEGMKYEVDAILENSATFKGTYFKENTSSEVLELVMDAAIYNANERNRGNFYVKMNDNAWDNEMAIDLYADPTADLLPAGTYVFSDEKTVGTVSSISYLSTYKPPYQSLYFAEGTNVIVTLENGTYTFDMNLVFQDGSKAHVTYSGEISGTPAFFEE